MHRVRVPVDVLWYFHLKDTTANHKVVKKNSNLCFFMGENQLCVHHNHQREARHWSATPKNPFLFAPNFTSIQFWQKPEAYRGPTCRRKQRMVWQTKKAQQIPLPPQKDEVGEATTLQSHCPGLLSTAPAPYSPKAGTHKCHLWVLTFPFIFPAAPTWEFIREILQTLVSASFRTKENLRFFALFFPPQNKESKKHQFVKSKDDLRRFCLPNCLAEQ